MSRLGTTLIFALALSLPIGAATRDEPRSAAYRDGQRALDDQEWDEAARIFGELAATPSEEADAALYWKAYADWKRKLKKESLEGLRRLEAAYPRSPWIDDAKALQLEIRDGKKGPAGADVEDEELKLYALRRVMQVDPDQAVPVLERILSGSSSPRLKERALFVLSQSTAPRASEILLRIARTGQPIELRCEAIKTLGIAGQPDDLAALAAIARETSAPREVRHAVVQAYLISNQSDELVGIATSDPDPQIRVQAIQALGATGALPSLRRLWTTEKDAEIRAKLLEAFGIAGDVDTLVKAARESSEPEVRRKAIQGLGIANGPTAAAALRQLYGELSTPDDKRAVGQALMVHGEAKTLMELFRAEKDPSLKRHLLQQLSLMHDPEVTRMFLDVLGDSQ